MSMKKEFKLSIVVPAYNEKERITKMINSYINFLSMKYDYEIIVVHDGNDGTGSLIKNVMIDRPNIKLIEFSERQGKGRAIIHGFKECTGEILAFVDADESVSPEEFDKLMSALKDVDCAIASRRAKGAYIPIDKSLKRKISSKIFNIIVNMMFDLNIKDTQCGAKVFKKEVIYQVISSLKTKGFEFDVELLWRIKNGGFKIKEVPIVWKHDNGSTFSLKYSYNMLISLIKIRLANIKGK
jgi:glycosyltransferase involved in cell wall biosynthesis